MVVAKPTIYDKIHLNLHKLIISLVATNVMDSKISYELFGLKTLWKSLSFELRSESESDEKNLNKTFKKVYKYRGYTLHHFSFFKGHVFNAVRRQARDLSWAGMKIRTGCEFVMERDRYTHSGLKVFSLYKHGLNYKI